MRFAKISRTLLLLALPAAHPGYALAQEHPNVQPSAVRDQLMKQASGAPQAQSTAPVNAPANKPTQSPAKAPAKAPGKGAVQKAAPKTADEKPAAPRRDPFEALLNDTKPGAAAPVNLPPGKAGLIVSTLRIDGIVRGAGGMIAIVSNPQQRVYFLREGDKLYDGSIEHITLEAITFHEIGKDAFGKPLEREVTRRLYPSPGEQQ
jgi:Tfp pilus assembly protein PilP